MCQRVSHSDHRDQVGLAFFGREVDFFPSLSGVTAVLLSPPSAQRFPPCPKRVCRILPVQPHPPPSRDCALPRAPATRGAQTPRGLCRPDGFRALRTHHTPVHRRRQITDGRSHEASVMFLISFVTYLVRSYSSVAYHTHTQRHAFPRSVHWIDSISLCSLSFAKWKLVCPASGQCPMVSTFPSVILTPWTPMNPPNPPNPPPPNHLRPKVSKYPRLVVSNMIHRFNTHRPKNWNLQKKLKVSPTKAAPEKQHWNPRNTITTRNSRGYAPQGIVWCEPLTEKRQPSVPPPTPGWREKACVGPPVFEDPLPHRL